MQGLNSKTAKQHLIIFTRYPEPGKTKTRLIPVLGAVGAADLQRQMTEHTLLQVRQLQRISSISCEVRFTGGNLQLIQDWLGSDVSYQSQGDGDLGTRMERSLLCAFESGAEHAIIIGTDCPGINPGILASAFNQLHQCDLVLGPAIDGGYYLIGSRSCISELFTNIDWGTNRVLQQTVDIANKLNLSVIQLTALADVDLPEDLAIWAQ